LPLGAADIELYSSEKIDRVRADTPSTEVAYPPEVDADLERA